MKSLLKPQIGMRTGVGKRQNEHVVLDGVNQHPVAFDENMNSSSLFKSVQVGAFGSFAISSASLIASISLLLRCSRPILNGRPPTSRHFFKKHVNAVVMFSPSSSKSSLASVFSASSMRIVNVVVIASFLSDCENECIVSHSECKVNGRDYTENKGGQWGHPLAA